ncbi:N-acyl homoserine lactonase family protein [Pseudonocardia acidicola]|uniref:N-acyl homoserine lactonase family protein n=1 Tax=Pseudonocardia acidicola TaxID=2724939 RepID=A0ABX1S2Z9_9PSEU|nr:N-acyl homoserine lactonase family protein [Pseudonocardia acidicola]NMH95935.1 N-acyl homoserine lactonase family protein [Pseudonocardia acidicola]
MTTGTATKLWALDGAKFTLDRGLLVVGGTGNIYIPVPTYVIQHPRGLVLVDTGIAPEAVDDPEGTYGELATHLGLEYTSDLRVDKQLEAVGFKADDITHVIITHSHFDHTGAIKLFPNARFYIGAPDLAYAYWPMPAASVFFRTADIEPARGFNWNPLTGDHDLFGDGSIQILSLPGHTPGNSSVLVRLPNQNIMLTGDTVHVPEALSDDLPMPSDYSTLDAVHSIRRLKQIAHANDATIIIQHDPDDWAKLKALGEAID